MKAPSSRWNELIRVVAVIAVALLIGFLITLAVSDEPVKAYTAFLLGPLPRISFDGGFHIQNINRFGNWMEESITLVLLGLSVAIVFKAKQFSLGAEGQLLLGALADQFKLCLLATLHFVRLRLELQLHLLDLALLLHLGLLQHQLRWRARLRHRLALRVQDEVIDVLLPTQLHHLRHGVVDVLRLDHKLTKRRLSQAHLRLQQVCEHCDLLLLVASAKTHVHGHVVLVSPLVGVVLHELPAQAECKRLHLSSSQELEDAQEDWLNQRLGEDAGD